MCNTHKSCFTRRPNHERHIHSRKGAVVVEAALTLPLLVIIMLCIVEYSRAIMVQQLLDNACREGARLAVQNNATATGVTNAVTAYLQKMNISGATVSVTPNPLSSSTNGQGITVAVSFNLSNASWCAPVYAYGIVLKSSCIMRRDGTQW